MGKCVSKDHHIRIDELVDSSTYIAITDDFEYFHHEEVGAFTKLKNTSFTRFCELSQNIPKKLILET